MEKVMNIIDQIDSQQITELGKSIPDFSPGDTLRVGYKVSEGSRSRVQRQFHFIQTVMIGKYRHFGGDRITLLRRTNISYCTLPR